MNTNNTNYPAGYEILTSDNLILLLSDNEVCQEKLGSDSSTWKVQTLSDGNINEVFLIESPKDKLIIKQALPYIRIIKDWPLKLQRIVFENAALQQQMKVTPNLVPKVYYFDEKMYFIIMEYLADHIIMRKGMINAIEYPQFADDITTYITQNLFMTSDYHLDSETKRELVTKYSQNSEMCKTTEDVIFTQPFMQHDNNHWNSPHLDDLVNTIQTDPKIKLAVISLKEKFINKVEALIHADLHTGSIMVTKDSTKVIDAEFQFMGPMAFDVGKLFANLIINYYSHFGHEKEKGDRSNYQSWIIKTIEKICQGITNKFTQLFKDSKVATGSLIPTDPKLIDDLVLMFLKQLWVDTLGFSAVCVVRRIVGIAHNEDLESITDEKIRARCESMALNYAIWILSHENVNDITYPEYIEKIKSIATK